MRLPVVDGNFSQPVVVQQHIQRRSDKAFRMYHLKLVSLSGWWITHFLGLWGPYDVFRCSRFYTLHADEDNCRF